MASSAEDKALLAALDRFVAAYHDTPDDADDGADEDAGPPSDPTPGPPVQNSA